MSGDADRTEELIATAHEVVPVAQQLTAAMVEYQERARLARRRYLATIAVLLVGFAVLYVRQTDTDNSARGARQTILDCIKPSTDPHTCFAQGQARTAAVIGNVQKIIVLAASCAPDYAALPLPNRIVAIGKCITQGLR